MSPCVQTGMWYDMSDRRDCSSTTSSAWRSNFIPQKTTVQDINDDGYGDVAIGHPLADPGSVNSAGVVYVVFGGDAMQSSINVLTDLDGSNGFSLEGASAGDRSGTSISGAGVGGKFYCQII